MPSNFNRQRHWDVDEDGNFCQQLLRTQDTTQGAGSENATISTVSIQTDLGFVSMPVRDFIELSEVMPAPVRSNTQAYDGVLHINPAWSINHDDAHAILGAYARNGMEKAMEVADSIRQRKQIRLVEIAAKRAAM